MFILVAIVIPVLAYPYIMAYFSGNVSNTNELFSERPGEVPPRPCKYECFDILTTEYVMHTKNQKVVRAERVLERFIPEPNSVYGTVSKLKSVESEVKSRNLDVDVYSAVKSEKKDDWMLGVSKMNGWDSWIENDWMLEIVVFKLPDDIK